MQEIIDRLTQLSNKCPELTMGAIDKRGFETYFAKIYSELNQVYCQKHFREEFMQILQIAYKLLGRAYQYHVGKNITATPYAVELFENAVQLLLKIINNEFGVNESIYGQAYKTGMQLRALKACGITLPGYSSQPYLKKADTDALQYAAANIEEFANFVYRVARAGTTEGETLNGPRSDSLDLYKQVSLLMGANLLVSF